MNEPVFWMEQAARLLMLVAGLGIAAHYHLMANFITRAPHFVRAVLLPVATAGGVGMIACAATGNLIGGLVATEIAVSAVILVNLAAWDAGMHASAAFEAAAKAADEHMHRTRQMVRVIADSADGVGKGLDLLDLPIVTPNGWLEVDASDQRAAERAGGMQ